jgi:hypothetical protein
MAPNRAMSECLNAKKLRVPQISIVTHSNAASQEFGKVFKGNREVDIAIVVSEERFFDQLKELDGKKSVGNLGSTAARVVIQQMHDPLQASEEAFTGVSHVRTPRRNVT